MGFWLSRYEWTQKRKKKNYRTEKRNKKLKIRQAESSGQRSDNYGNKENHIFCMLKFVILKFIPMIHLKHLALIKRSWFLVVGKPIKDLQDVYIKSSIYQFNSFLFPLEIENRSLFPPLCFLLFFLFKATILLSLFQLPVYQNNLSTLDDI